MTTRLHLHQAAFRPKARLLRLLGDQLIGAPVMAVFELVKNSYDADASTCNVTVVEPQDPERASISVVDDGAGMTLDDINDSYLQLATEHRRRQKESGQPFTPRYGRMPMGEKGIGRLAALRLGDRITVVTTAAAGETYRIVMDWESGIDEDAYLDEVRIPVERLAPSDHRGTTVVIESLRNRWTRESVAELQRNLGLMYMPSQQAAAFQVGLDVRSEEREVRMWPWDSGWVDAERLLKRARLGSIHGTVHANGPGSNRMDYFYTCTDPAAKDCYRTGYLVPLDGAPSLSEQGLNRFDFSVAAYDTEAPDLDEREREFLTRYLEQWEGMRIYRDGMRVHHDRHKWYDAQSVSGPVAPDGRRHVGEVALKSEHGWNALREQASREQISGGPALDALTQAVQTGFHRFRAHQFEERENDFDAGFAVSARQLRDMLATHTEHPELPELAERIVQQFDDQIEQFLVSSTASQYVAASFDELVEATAHILDLSRQLDQESDLSELQEVTGRADRLVGNLSYALRRSGWSEESLATIASRCADITHERRRRAGITLVNGFEHGQDIKVSMMRRLVVGALLHLLDNSMYWLEQLGPQNRSVYIGPCARYSGERGIVVVDNGPGFRDDPRVLLRPNASLKKDALGLGLYTVERVMRHHGGKLEFYPEGRNVRRPENLHMSIPEDVDTGGAGVILLFPWDDGSGW